MKKLIFLLLLVCSCEKDKDREPALCWECRWENTKPLEYHSTVKDVCDKTESWIRDYEAENTWINGTEENEMTCWKKGDPAIPPDE